MGNVGNEQWIEIEKIKASWLLGLLETIFTVPGFYPENFV